MWDGISHAVTLVIAIAVNATLAWAAYRVYARAGFPGAWFVGPACFLFPVVGLLSVLLHLAIADWPALAAAKGLGSAGPAVASDRGGR